MPPRPSLASPPPSSPCRRPTAAANHSLLLAQYWPCVVVHHSVTITSWSTAQASRAHHSSSGNHWPHTKHGVVAVSPPSNTATPAAAATRAKPAGPCPTATTPATATSTPTVVTRQRLRTVFDELCNQEPACVVNARQLASLVRHCGGACSEDDVRRAMAEIRTGEPLDNVQSFEEFCKVLERWPGLEFSHLDKDTLHTVDSEHLEAPVVSNLPRILSQLPVPKMLLSFIAGGLAGVLAKTAVAPLDRTKIMFQVTHRPFTIPAAIALMKDIVTREGPAGLFKGNTAAVLRVIPYSGVQLMSFDQYKLLILKFRPRKAGRTQERLTALEKFGAGAAAGLTSVAVTYPLDLLRARLAVEQQRSTLRDVLHRTVRHEGLPALYRGIGPTLLGIVPYGGLAFLTFESLKQAAFDRTGKRPSTVSKLVMGGIAGFVGQTFVYPLDVIRRRMQTMGFSGLPTHELSHSAFGLRGMMQLGAHVHATEGWKGLFKGLSLNYVKGPIAIGISFTAFDTFKRYLGVEKMRIEA